MAREDVLGLEVAVRDAVLVTVLDARHDLQKNALDLVGLALESAAVDALTEAAALA